MHTLHYITLHYSTVQYITYIHTYTYIYTYIPIRCWLMLVVILSRCTLWVSLKLPPSAPQKKGAELLSRHQTWSQRWAECRWHPCLLPQTIAVSVKTWGKHGKTPLKYLGVMINEQKRNHVSMQYATSPLRQGRTRLSCWKSPVLCHCVAVVCVMRSGHSFLQLKS